MVAPETTVVEAIEAEVRRHMAVIAKMERRGWDCERARAAEIAVLDGLIDQWNEMTRA